MGIYGDFWGFLKCVGKTTIFGKKVMTCNFSGYEGGLSDVETFLNILLFVV